MIDGLTLDDYVLIADMIYIETEPGELYGLSIDDLPGEEEGEMHDACVAYLRRRGARAYSSEADYHASGS